MRLNFIKEQTEWVANWTVNLISDVTEEESGIVESIGTSINWIYGHIVISQYFHALQSVLKDDHAIVQEINSKWSIEDMFKYYFADSDPRAVWSNSPSFEKLISFGKDIDLAVSQMFEELKESGLDAKTVIGNPIAKSKYDALSFNFKHQMWHLGQIAMMKRLVRKE